MGKRRKPTSSKRPEADDGDLIFSGGEDSDSYEKFSKMGFISFEEITGEEAEAILGEAAKMKKAKPAVVQEAKPAKKKAKKETAKMVQPDTSAPVQLDAGDLPVWRKYPLKDEVLLGLKRLGFVEPTPIQEQTLSAFYTSGSDVLGTAPTGSGKTLAFGLPILNRIVEVDDLAALIIVPTRELAIQVKDHLVAVLPRLRIATLIGGMSSQKQERLLARNPHVIVGTPGRLDDCLSANTPLQTKVAAAPFLVIDEADRLVESGHFKELDSILSVLYRAPCPQRRTFLFSATLTFERDGARKAQNPLEQLRSKIRFSGPPVMINLDTRHRVAEKLTISKMYAMPEEKDLFLVHYLLGHSWSKMLVFVNAIDILKRVTPVLEVFGIPTTSLHAQMQQRQRLQHLDRFKSAPRMVLVTSDVAARGLDIPTVDTVIHYHLPSSADTFVHRSGRTARAQRSGTSVALISPGEINLEKSIVKHLGFPNGELPADPVDLGRVESMKPLVDLARQIETLQSALNKASKEESWEAKAAADLGVDLDDIHGVFGKKQRKKKTAHDEDDDDDGTKRKKNQLASLKNQFAQLFKQYNNN